MDSTYYDLENSVKQGDMPFTKNGVAYFLVPHLNDYQKLPYDLPANHLQRDRWLYYSVQAETMWANAVNIAITKMSAVAWDVESSVPIRAKRIRELLLMADGGQGWVRFLGKHLRDFLTTGNGGFIEIERYGSSYGSRIKAIHHLDSQRCTRTGDPERPVLYRGLDGREHEMRYWQVVSFSDMPSSRATDLGRGMCAAQRAWKTISKLAAIERYIWEKVTGRRPLAIHFVGGASPRDTQIAAQAAQAEARAKNVAHAMGALIVNVLGNTPATVATVPLAGLPDGFDVEHERKIGYLHYSNAIGLDPQDVQPISNQAMGAGAQSEVLAQKAKGMGLAAWRQDFTHQLTQLVMDDKTRFVFSEMDIRDERAQAEVRGLRGQARAVQIASGEITVEEARQIAADDGDLPQSFLSEDRTTDVSLSDTEKPIEEAPETAKAWRIQWKERDEHEAKLSADTEVYLRKQYQQAAKDVKTGITEVEQMALDFDGKEWQEIASFHYPVILESGFGGGAQQLGLSLAFTLENKHVQKVLDELAQSVSSVPETTKADIQDLVGKYAKEGWSLDDLARQIGELAEIKSKERAEIIAITETAAAYTRGSLLAYEESGVVEEVEWLVFKPCPICNALAGKRVKLGKMFNSGGWSGFGPPAHPKCKCAVAPIVSMENLKLRTWIQKTFKSRILNRWVEEQRHRRMPR